MSYLNNLRIFVRVVELESLSAAGRDQRVSPAVASNSMKELEKQLGVRLFNRSTRRLAITQEGQRFLVDARAALRLLDQAVGLISQGGGKGTPQDETLATWEPALTARKALSQG